jgi:hypothetical protein
VDGRIARKGVRRVLRASETPAQQYFASETGRLTIILAVENFGVKSGFRRDVPA